PCVMSVPPLNSKNPDVLFNTRLSTSISPALKTLVPRRTSSVPVPPTLAAFSVPPSTTTRLLAEKELTPTQTSPAKTDPRWVTSRRCPLPLKPTDTPPVLLQREPAPVTTARLLELAVATPICAPRAVTIAPLLTINWLPAPTLPTRRVLALLQSEP